MVTIDNENYLRTILLLCEGSTYISKLVFSRELQGQGGNLDDLLLLWKNKLKHEFHKKQMEKFFPNDGHDKTDINKWDIQMIIGVMLLLFRSTLTDKEKRILREIKYIRHEVLAHSSSASLCREKYEDIQKQLKHAMIYLAKKFDQDVKTKCEDFINAYTTGALDVRSASKRLKEAKDTDDLFQEILSVLQKAKKEVKEQIQGAASNLKKDLKIVKKDIKCVRSISDSIEKQVEELKDADCNTFKALTKVQSQIEDMQKTLADLSKSQQSRKNEDLRNMAYELQQKSKEIECQIKTYDMASLQATTVGTLEGQHISFCPDVTSKKRNTVLVTAIDFGTTYSGYAFSFKDRYKLDPMNIMSKQFFPINGPVCLKTPTSVLFDKNEKFHSFGFEAESYYGKDCDEGEKKDWYLFRHFKTSLYNRKITRSMTIMAVNGKTMKAKDVFTAAIKYLKDDMIACLSNGVMQKDIHWIITVPAIWTDPAKLFMREAASKAGIDNEYLSIALEPEAASIYCQTVPTYSFTNGGLEAISSGKMYMVIDLGGKDYHAPF